MFTSGSLTRIDLGPTAHQLGVYTNTSSCVNATTDNYTLYTYHKLKIAQTNEELVFCFVNVSLVSMLHLATATLLVYPLSYFLFQPVLYNWCNKGLGMCYPICGMVHIKYPLLLIGKCSP